MKARFLAAYVIAGTVRAATAAAHISRETHFSWLRESGPEYDPQYAAAFAHTKTEAGERLKEEAIRRAHDGVEEPVIFKGKLCGRWLDADGQPTFEGMPDATFVPLTIRKKSDVLLIFLLKAAFPEEFRERYEHTGAGGKDLIPTDRIVVVVGTAPASPS